MVILDNSRTLGAFERQSGIMTYFNGTLQEFTYSHEQVTEISIVQNFIEDFNIYLEREYCEY